MAQDFLNLFLERITKEKFGLLGKDLETTKTKKNMKMKSTCSVLKHRSIKC